MQKQFITSKNFYIGCAGWNIPRPFAGSFPLSGTHLQRYAQIFSAVEINSSFYRHHKPESYKRWANAVPEGFRFAVKAPRTITHERRFVGSEAELETFVAAIRMLGRKLGPILLQLPPSFRFQRQIADQFFVKLRQHFRGQVVIEPRHASWFQTEPQQLLYEYQISRVAADPACVPEAAEPMEGGDIAYYRLHGSPQIYYSPYNETTLTELAERLKSHSASAKDIWCIFDNTIVGYSTDNALYMLHALQKNESRFHT